MHSGKQHLPFVLLNRKPHVRIARPFVSRICCSYFVDSTRHPPRGVVTFSQAAMCLLQFVVDPAPNSPPGSACSSVQHAQCTVSMKATLDCSTRG
jgi:hypothetical protein